MKYNFLSPKSTHRNLENISFIPLHLDNNVETLLSYDLLIFFNSKMEAREEYS